MDVINLISKVEGLPDAAIISEEQEYHSGHLYFANGYFCHNSASCPLRVNKYD